MFCKNCKNTVRPADIWYLFDISGFKERKLLVGKCAKCKQSVISLIEIRKTDDKIFIQNEVGKKAEHVAEICLNQINYTLEDTKEQESAPKGFVYGKTKKDIKNKRYNIYRVDFNNREELIGHIPFGQNRIINIERELTK